MAPTLMMAALRAVAETAQAHALGAITDSETPGAYLGRRLGAFQPAMAAVAGLGKDASIPTLWEPRAMDCLPECSPDPWLDCSNAAQRELGTLEQILQARRRTGYTFVLLYRIEMEIVRQNDTRCSAEDWNDMSRRVSSLNPVASLYGAYDLYRLTP